MGRTIIKITDKITLIHGQDHALGTFFDITDADFAGTKHDEQGEGYVYEWSEKFRNGNNKINIKPEVVMGIVSNWAQEESVKNLKEVVVNSCKAHMNSYKLDKEAIEEEVDNVIENLEKSFKSLDIFNNSHKEHKLDFKLFLRRNPKIYEKVSKMLQLLTDF